jgi:hypothetical protein
MLHIDQTSGAFSASFAEEDPLFGAAGVSADVSLQRGPETAKAGYAVSGCDVVIS